MHTEAPVPLSTVLCGGADPHLWPASREQHPKTFLQVEDGESLFQRVFLGGAFSLKSLTL